jgi:hypothetical protein
MRLIPRWKATFSALVAVKHKSLTVQEDDSPESYRQACYLIDDELQVITESVPYVTVACHVGVFFLIIDNMY